MAETDHKATIFNGNKGDGLPKARWQEIEKKAIASMLSKGFELGLIDKMLKDRGAFFHGVIITSLLLMATGCGYKTDPVYVPQVEHNLSRGGIR